LKHVDGTIVPLRWPDLVVSAGYPIANRNADPLSFTSFAGNIEIVQKSFGRRANEPVARDGSRQPHLARSGNTIWAAELTRYRLTQWSATGEILRVLERKPAWFDENRADWGGPDKPPREHIAGLAIDERGFLWVLINVAAPTWREAWPSVPPGTREISSDRIRRDKQYRTIIEVIDPTAGRVVARQNFNEYFATLFSNQHAAIFYIDWNDIPHYSIVRLSVAQTNR
jgi:hypothetical protein